MGVTKIRNDIEDKGLLKHITHQSFSKNYLLSSFSTITILQTLFYLKNSNISPMENLAQMIFRLPMFIIFGVVAGLLEYLFVRETFKGKINKESLFAKYSYIFIYNIIYVIPIAIVWLSYLSPVPLWVILAIASVTITIYCKANIDWRKNKDSYFDC